MGCVPASSGGEHLAPIKAGIRKASVCDVSMAQPSSSYSEGGEYTLPTEAGSCRLSHFPHLLCWLRGQLPTIPCLRLLAMLSWDYQACLPLAALGMSLCTDLEVSQDNTGFILQGPKA